MENNSASNDYILKFELSPFNDLESFARLANHKDNLGDKGDWLNHFLWGLDGLLARILGVEIHYYQIHSWELVALPGIPYQIVESHLYKVTEYHLSTILFNMDSGIECMVYTLNALGYAADLTLFKDVTNEKELKRIRPSNILAERPDNRKELVSGYDKYFPLLKSYWLENRDFILTISNQHDVSKHRSAIFEGGKRRMDQPPDFFKKLGIEDKTEQIVLSPFAEISLPSQPKIPWRKREPREYKDIDKLENIAKKFQTFINMSGVKALEDAQRNIKLKKN